MVKGNRCVVCFFNTTHRYFKSYPVCKDCLLEAKELVEKCGGTMRSNLQALQQKKKEAFNRLKEEEKAGIHFPVSSTFLNEENG